MKVLVVVPARLESKRLPKKMLRRLGNRTLIEWTWRSACRSGFPCLVATDSDKVAAEAELFGARVVRTGSCNNGTERCASVMNVIQERFDIVVNWQGDCPLAPRWLPGALVRALEETKVQVATPVHQVDHLVRGQAVAVVGLNEQALYFTRSPVPAAGPWWAHIGMYAYRTRALARYGIRQSPLEIAEELEQIRWLELGEPVRCLPVPVAELPEVNEPADVAIVAEQLGALG